MAEHWEFTVGGRIRHFRDALGMSRRKCVEEVNRREELHGKRQLHEITLYRWERGGDDPPEHMLRAIASVLGVEPEQFHPDGSTALGVAEPLRVAAYPFPDTILLELIMNAGNGVFAKPAIKVEMVPGSWSDAVGSVAGSSPKAHLTLANSVQLASRKPTDCVCLPDSAIIRYRGYALLTTGGPGLRTFKQALLDTGRGVHSQRGIGEALVATLMRVADAKAALCVAGGTDMQEVLCGLLQLAVSAASGSDEEQVLGNLLDRARAISATMEEAFLEFCDCLRNDRPAVYVGGLSQRLIAEELGAAPLIGGMSDLNCIARLARKERAWHQQEWFRTLTRPENCLVVSPDAHLRGQSALQALRTAWNANVERLAKSPAWPYEARLPGLFYASRMDEWLHGLGGMPEREIGRLHGPMQSHLAQAFLEEHVSLRAW